MRMSHKSTRSLWSGSDFQVDRDQDLYSTRFMDRARPTVNSVQERASNHVGLLTGIGLACGAAAYLLGTEQGRKITKEIGNVLSDSLNIATDILADNFIRLRDTTIGLVNRTI